MRGQGDDEKASLAFPTFGHGLGARLLDPSLLNLACDKPADLRDDSRHVLGYRRRPVDLLGILLLIAPPRSPSAASVAVAASNAVRSPNASVVPACRTRCRVWSIRSGYGRKVRGSSCNSRRWPSPRTRETAPPRLGHGYTPHPRRWRSVSPRWRLPGHRGSNPWRAASRFTPEHADARAAATARRTTILRRWLTWAPCCRIKSSAERLMREGHDVVPCPRIVLPVLATVRRG